MGQVRWEMYIQHTISVTLPPTYQNLVPFVEIWRSYDRNKNAQFFWDTCRQPPMLGTCHKSPLWLMLRFFLPAPPTGHACLLQFTTYMLLPLPKTTSPAAIAFPVAVQCSCSSSFPGLFIAALWHLVHMWCGSTIFPRLIDNDVQDQFHLANYASILVYAFDRAVVIRKAFE